MKEEEALKKVQIALDNDAEVYVSRIEQCESASDQTARHYEGMLNLTETLDDEAEKFQETKQELINLLGQLEKAEDSVARFEAMARESDELSQELDVKTKRLTNR